MVKICLPVQEMKEACVRSLGLEDPLEKEISTYSSSSVGKESAYSTGRPVQFQDQKDLPEKEMATLSVFLPGESHGQRSLAGYSPWGCKSWI